MPIITLLTDFGVDDQFAGVMKGAILSVNPAATIIDITHNIDPHDIVRAAYLIKSYYAYFPQKTVHVAVVDPGVGSSRAIIALETNGQIFLGPDNGILSFILNQKKKGVIVRVENPKYFFADISHTFHGRDIFAPVSAHLSLGVPLKELGPIIDGKASLRISERKPFLSEKGELTGIIEYSDRFGNLVTNIDSKIIEKFFINTGKKIRILIADNIIEGLSNSYKSAAGKKLLAIIGSSGYLEISVNLGSAKLLLKAKQGDIVKMFLIDQVFS